MSAQGSGYASAAASDESARGEQWMPLWSQPITIGELRRLLAEGRAQLGARSASEPLDLARAVARLGTARGIHAFQRYAYIERNGQSNLAVPLGRFVVPEHAANALACLDDLEAWLKRLRRAARDRDAPARLAMAERRLADALFALTQHPHEASHWQGVLLRLADIEAIQIHGAGRKAGPIPRLRPEWIRAADDGSAELRLGVAFALQCGEARGGPRRDGIRRHWLTLEKGRYQADGSDRVIQGRNGVEDAIALLTRRLIEACQRGERRLPLEAGRGFAASHHDLARLLAGDVDLDRCMALARSLMALDISQLERDRLPLQRAPAADWPDDAWMAIRLALLPWPLPDGRRPGVDPAIVRRLQVGELAAALELALRRLRPAGIRCSLRAGASAPATARLFAAALAFPIDRSTAARFAKRLDPTATLENET
jgi:CRISPR-associated protein Csx17